MSDKYTAEHYEEQAQFLSDCLVEGKLPDGKDTPLQSLRWKHQDKLAAMLRQAAQMMRGREAVKVTEEDIDRALEAYSDADAECEIAYRPNMRAALESFAARHAAVPDVTKRVAEHMARSVEYIEKVYPNARQLDAGPILRNLRRWSRMLAAAMAKESGNG